MKAFALCTQVGGMPILGDPPLPCTGWVQCGTIGQFGGYLFSGTAAQLIAINALANVIGLVAMTETGDVRWAELDGNLPAALRTRLNTFLTARGWPTIPTGWTYRQTVVEIFKRLNDRWDLSSHNILDS